MRSPVIKPRYVKIGMKKLARFAQCPTVATPRHATHRDNRGMTLSIGGLAREAPPTYWITYADWLPEN